VKILNAFTVKKALKKLSDTEIDELKEMIKKMGNFYKQKKIQSYVYVKENLNI